MRPGLTVSLLLVAGLLGCAPEEAPPATGELLFVRHCASCHGADAEGDGELAAVLRQPPADLTRIAERAGGRFDPRRVMAVIDGRREVAAHGPREMPVWGVVFERERSGQPYEGVVGKLHSRALTEYIASLQR